MEGKLIKEKKVHEEKVYILIKCSEKYLISGSWDRLIKVFKFGLVWVIMHDDIVIMKFLDSRCWNMMNIEYICLERRFELYYS